MATPQPDSLLEVSLARAQADARELEHLDVHFHNPDPPLIGDVRTAAAAARFIAALIWNGRNEITDIDWDDLDPRVRSRVYLAPNHIGRINTDQPSLVIAVPRNAKPWLQTALGIYLNELQHLLDEDILLSEHGTISLGHTADPAADMWTNITPAAPNVTDDWGLMFFLHHLTQQDPDLDPVQVQRAQAAFATARLAGSQQYPTPWDVLLTYRATAAVVDYLHQLSNGAAIVTARWWVPGIDDEQTEDPEVVLAVEGRIGLHFHDVPHYVAGYVSGALCPDPAPGDESRGMMLWPQVPHPVRLAYPGELVLPQLLPLGTDPVTWPAAPASGEDHYPRVPAHTSVRPEG